MANVGDDGVGKVYGCKKMIEELTTEKEDYSEFIRQECLPKEMHIDYLESHKALPRRNLAIAFAKGSILILFEP